jgi:hypothetical protein
MHQISDNTSSVYSNTILATLNSRSRFRAALDEPISLELPSMKLSQHTSGKDGLAPPRAATPLNSLCFAERGSSVVDSGLSVPGSHDFRTRHDPNFEPSVEGLSAW